MKLINRIASEISGALVSVMALLLVVECLSRGIRQPVPWVTEYAVFSLVVIIWLGFSHCEELRGHVKADVFVSRLPPRLRHTTNLFSYFIQLLLFALVLYAVGTDVLLSWRTHESVAALVVLPLYPVKFVLVIGCGFYLVQLLLNTIEEFRERRAMPR